MANHILISGCSGGGKSTLVASLKARGHRVVEEPGRRVIAAQKVSGGNALPWTSMIAFLRETHALAQKDLAWATQTDERVFFDRGLIDVAVALEYYAGVPVSRTIGADRPYHRKVIMAPPWPEIYRTDTDRRHGFDEAVAEHDRIQSALIQLGYSHLILPKTSVSNRVEFVLSQLS